MRSVLAVLAGFAAMTVVVIVATVLAAGMLPEPSRASQATATTAWLAVNFAYSLAAAMLGGWLAARLAPHAPFAHAIALAAVALAMAAPSILRGASAGQPGWYPAVMTAIAVAGILAGGRLSRRRASVG
jgi:hypothetical protein